jgi:hypothetical protein
VLELHGAKEHLVRSEETLARVVADCSHVQQDIQAKQVSEGVLLLHFPCEIVDHRPSEVLPNQ